MARLDLDCLRKRRRAKEPIDHAQQLAGQQVTVYVIAQSCTLELRALTLDQLLDLTDEDPASQPVPATDRAIAPGRGSPLAEHEAPPRPGARVVGMALGKGKTEHAGARDMSRKHGHWGLAQEAKAWATRSRRRHEREDLRTELDELRNTRRSHRP